MSGTSLGCYLVKNGFFVKKGQTKTALAPKCANFFEMVLIFLFTLDEAKKCQISLQTDRQTDRQILRSQGDKTTINSGSLGLRSGKLNEV